TQSRRIQTIIFLMTASLLALISLQAYLIYRAYAQQSQQFDQSVSELLNSVKYKVERHHIESKVNQEFHLKEIESALRRNIDSIWVKNAGISLPNATEEAVYLSSDGDPILFSENNSEMMLDRFNVNVEAVRSNPAELKSIFTELIFGYL